MDTNATMTTHAAKRAETRFGTARRAGETVEVAAVVLAAEGHPRENPLLGFRLATGELMMIRSGVVTTTIPENTRRRQTEIAPGDLVRVLGALWSACAETGLDLPPVLGRFDLQRGELDGAHLLGDVGYAIEHVSRHATVECLKGHGLADLRVVKRHTDGTRRIAHEWTLGQLAVERA